MNVRLCSIGRGRALPVLTRLNRFLLLHNLGYVDVLNGHYVAVLQRDRVEDWPDDDPDHVGQGGRDAGWYER